MKVAILQPNPTAGDISGAMAQIDVALAAASKQGAKMLVAPELMLPGYHCPDVHRAAAQDQSGEWMVTLAAMARHYRCGLTIGWAERDDGDCIYNAACVFDTDGCVIAHHRKCILFGEMEKSVFQRGAGDPHVFDFCGRRLGILICYEIEFPEPARALARCGADAILVPTANPIGYDEVQDILIPARACENALSVVYANFCGTENGLTYGGRSIVVGPNGKPLAQAGLCPNLIVADLPPVKRGTLAPQITDYDQAYRQK